MNNNNKHPLFGYFVSLLILVGCIEESELPFDNYGSRPGYFVECYLIPGELYKLTATRLQSLDQDYILDYSTEFTVYVDTIRLSQSLYRDNISDYLYNFGSFKRFNPGKNTGQLNIRLITEKKDTISGTTTVPEKVDILNFKNEEKDLSFDFHLSNNAIHNYYMVSINRIHNDTTHSTTKFLDYSKQQSINPVNFEFSFDEDKKQPVRLNVIFRRLTEANYNYQLSLENAKDANNDNLILPAPLDGNLKGATGIFTCYTVDSVNVVMK